MKVVSTRTPVEAAQSAEPPVRLLIAVDHVDSAAEVLRQISPLAALTRAQIDLLTVLDPHAFHDTVAHGGRRGSGGLYGVDTGWYGIGFGAGYVRIPQPSERVIEYASQEAEESHFNTLDSLELLAHEYFNGLDVRFVVEESTDIPSKILDAAAEAKANFIVIAGHHGRALLEPAVGHVTQDVLDRSTIPVLVIPTGRSGPSSSSALPTFRPAHGER